MNTFGERGDHAVSDKIDIVYLWVNLADPLWNQKRERTFSEWQERHGGDLALYGNVAGRYRDNGELRYSLRSLERFFPRHGHVYIVTDGQVPEWLEMGDGVTIIDHRALIPESALPVYDSNHIESYLHHIPNLSERFLYFNDDVFLGAPFVVDEWFTEAGVVVYPEKAPAPDYDCPQSYETALVNAAVLSRQWLAQRFPRYQHSGRVYAHSPRPMLKSSLHEIEEAAGALFSQARSTRFRSWKTPVLVADLVPRWMVQTGRAVEVAVDPVYICTGDADAERQFSLLKRMFGTIKFFCINDTCDDALDDDPRLARVSNVLSSLLPARSRFERDVGDVAKAA